MKAGSLLLALLLAAAPLAAQQPEAQTPRAESSSVQLRRPIADHAMNQQAKKADIIMPHITDSHVLELPWFNREAGKEIHLPRWKPVHIGKLAIDLSPTKHVVMLALAGFLCCAVLIFAARMHNRQHDEGVAPHGFANGIEAMVLYVRNEVILENVGAHGQKFVPYLLTVFFFILFANLLGLIPYGSTATGNISVTAMLAIIAFIVIEIAGIRALGKAYFGTIVYWPRDMSLVPRILLSLILTPVEIVGKFTKPFALAIRLFANMTAGHVMVLALISLTFLFGPFIGLAPVLMAVGIMLLELFVAALQAYVFTLLVASFIGQIREAAH